MATFSINDIQIMSLALKLASQGRHGVGANPMVGCVITKNDQPIAQGYHQTYGQAHAEINALAQLNHQAQAATLYLTLEPCSHQGKTPPCAQAIINSGVSKVIIAMLDPNPLVNGQGVAMLKAAGIIVQIGLLAEQAILLNRGYITRMHHGRPFVTCKIASSLDGKTAMHSGESKWITGEYARQEVQTLRSTHQAIMTGSGTLLADNPCMTLRQAGVDFTPLRIVIDGKHQITDTTLNIFSDEAPTQVFNPDNTPLASSGKLDLRAVLQQLGHQGINSILLEAGPGLIGAMIEYQLIDEFIIYTAPLLMGSSAHSMIQLPIDTMSQALRLTISDVRMVGDDLRITASIAL